MSITPKPLIIAGDGDPHVDAVTHCLNKRGVDSVCINASYLVESSLTASQAEDFIGQNNLRQATSIWYRRIFPPTLPLDMENKWRAWCHQEYNQAFLGLLYSLQIPWIDDPFAVKRASLKTYQLWVAREHCGLPVPAYVVTSNADKAQWFVNTKCQGAAIVKPLGRPVVSSERSVATIFTNETNALTPSDYDSLKYAPCIFQKRIDKVAEIRVTVVGKTIFAARIDTEGQVTDVDYRKADPYKLRHQPIDLPSAIEKGCLALCQFFGLRFSAIDFLLDAENAYHFLEINPSGQWLWIEELTGLPIAQAIADELSAMNF